MQSSTVLRDACMTISYADVRSPSRNSNTRTTNWPSNMHVLPKPRQNDSRDLSIESLYTHASVAGSRFSKRLHEFFPAAVMSFFVQLETPTHAIIYFYFRTLRFCVFVSLRDVRGCKDRLFAVSRNVFQVSAPGGVLGVSPVDLFCMTTLRWKRHCAAGI